MKRDIVWLPEAEETFNQNIEYLSEEWTVQAINDFLDRVDEVIDHIAENPYLYASHENREDIRKCPVTKQITLYFRILESRIDLLTFWNTAATLFSAKTAWCSPDEEQAESNNRPVLP